MALIESLSKFEGVDGVVIVKSSGELDFHTGTDSPDLIASVAAVAAQSMMNLGELLRIGKFSHFVIKGTNTRIVAEKEQRIAALSLSGTSDTAALVECICSESWTIPSTIAQKRPAPPPLPPSAAKATVPGISRPLRAPAVSKKREGISTASIPPTPEAQSLKRLRAALYFGDISGCMPIVKEITCSEGRSGLTGGAMEAFVSRLDALTSLITELLDGRLNGSDSIDTFIADHKTDSSLVWAARIWSARLKLALGDTAGAEVAVTAAYQASQEFDSDTRTATRCSFAEVYNLSNQADKALSLISSGAATTARCQSETISAAIHLTEAHSWAIKRQFAQSDQSAKAAEERLPQSPYPKLMRARLAAAVGNTARARSLYQGVLKLNPTQPDALAELKILERIKLGTLSSADAAVYFHHREMAPTEDCLKSLRGLADISSGFPQAAGLLAWRLIGIGDTSVKNLSLALSLKSSEHRFKPSVVVGYGASCSIAVGYQSLGDRLLVPPGDDSHSLQIDSQSDFPPTLSLPPAELREHMAGLSADSLFSGELKMFCLPDLLEFLRNAHRTGSLLCSSPDGVGAVELVNGYVSSAIAPNVDTIGAILLRDEMISKKDLTDAAKLREKDLAGLRIGAILVEKGLVSAETIKKAITEQTFASIETMLSWNEGRFLFTPRLDTDVDRTKVEVKLDSQFLLMELFRRQDEKNRGGSRRGEGAQKI